MEVFPEDWKVVKLRCIIAEASYGVGAEAIPYNHVVKYIRITDINDETHGFTPSPLVSPAFYEEKHRVEKNDILIARTGASVGKSYLYNEKDGRLVYAGFLMRVRVVDSSNASYVFLQTLTNRYAEWVKAESTRTGQPGLNLEQLKSFAIPLPPLPEQRRIAAALGDMDKLIDNLSKRIEKKKAIKQGAMQELLTGKKRLPGFEGEWEMVELLGVTRMFSDGDWIESKDQCDCGIRLIQTGNVGCGCFKNKGDKKHFVSEETYSRLNCTEIVVGDVLVSRLPDPIGRACLVPKANERMITAVDCTIIRFAEYSAEFFVQYTQTPEYLWSVGSFMAGSTRQRISREALGKVKIPSPTLPEQRAIAKVLGDMDAEIAKLEAKREKLTGIKKGMMSDLLTGKVRLKTEMERRK